MVDDVEIFVEREKKARGNEGAGAGADWGCSIKQGLCRGDGGNTMSGASGPQLGPYTRSPPCPIQGRACGTQCTPVSTQLADKGEPLNSYYSIIACPQRCVCVCIHTCTHVASVYVCTTAVVSTSFPSAPRKFRSVSFRELRAPAARFMDRSACLTLEGDFFSKHSHELLELIN